MKAPANYVTFLESRWCSSAQFLSVSRIKKATSAIKNLFIMSLGPFKQVSESR
jgi:hypothetical protein